MQAKPHDQDHGFKKNPAYGLSEELSHSLTLALEKEDDTHTLHLLQRLHYADLADFISITRLENRRHILSLMGPHLNPLILVSLDRTLRQQILAELGFELVIKLISALEVDDALYVIEDLPASQQQTIIYGLPPVMQHALEEGLSYPDNSAGRLMQKRFVAIMEYWTVGQTIDYLRQNRDLPDDYYEIFVLDQKRRPAGSIRASKLLCQPRHMLVTEIMNKELKVVHTWVDQEEVSFLVTQYELSSVPVVNRDNRLVGIISVDDIVSVIEEEAEEDIMRMGGIGETDLHASSFRTARHRLPWLLINLLTAMLTVTVISMFEGTIEHMVVLASLMPVVASLGGNTGTQTLTVAVRSLATKELTTLNATRVIGKEVLAALLNGSTIALIAGGFIYFWHGDAWLSVVFAVAIVATFMIAAFMGTFIPVILARLGTDPAISSTVFLTATTDVMGFFSFLLLASLLLL